MEIHLPSFFGILNNNYILLITSNSKEKNAINKKLINQREYTWDNNKSHKCYIGMFENTFIIHLSGSSGISRPDSVSRLVVEYLAINELPNPAFTIIIGFCWGNPINTQQGNILISNEIYSLNYAKIVTQGNKYNNNNVYKSLFQIEKSLIENLNNQIRFGKMVSTEKLYASTNERDKIIVNYPDIIGGEMEGFGCIPSFEKCKIPWLILKAVSDLGDDNYDMDIQDNMAELAVNQISNIIEIIKKNIELSLNLDNDFVNILIGDTLIVNVESITSDDINDYLNDYIGPIVEQKLRLYYIEKYNKFNKLFCDLILEILQNAFKHSGADKVEVKFFKTKITIIETGEKHKFYTLNNLINGRGGFNSWNNVKNEFIENKKISYCDKGNKHTFVLDFLDEYLKYLMENCKVNIIKSSMGSNLLGKKIIEYNKACNEVFVDDTSIRMSSRRLSLAKEVKDLLEKGLKVYLLVDDEQNAFMYKDVLNENSENLKVFVK